MKKWFKQNKKILLIGSYTFLFLAIINLSVYSVTQTKYLKEDKKVLVYEDKMYQLYKGDAIDISYLNGSDDQNLLLRVSFNRNSNIGSDISTDTYKISLPNTCTITSISASNASDADIKKGTITFKNLGKQSIRVEASCQIDKSITQNKDIVIDALVEEKVNNEEYFTYLEKQSIFSDYLNQEFKDLYEQLTSWLENEFYPKYVDNNASLKLDANNVKTDIRNYIFVYHDIKVGEDYPTLKGLEISYDASTHKYSFATTKNFIGYAATKYINSTTNPVVMYFTTFDNTKTDSTDNNTILNNLFYEYLEEYFYPNNAEAIMIIKNYIDSLNLPNGIADFINTGIPNIRGLKWVNESEIQVNNLLNNILNNNRSPIEISSDTSTTMRNYFSRAFLEDTEVYGPHGEFGNLISDTFRNEVTTQTTLGLALYNSYTKNNQGRYSVDGADGKLPYIAFNDYFITYDLEKKDYVLMRIFSDGVADEVGKAHNKSYLQILNFTQEDVNIVFSNNVNTLDMQITISSPLGKEKILEVVRALDELFEINSFTGDVFNYETGFTDDNNLVYTLIKTDLNKVE